jgi:hypothetical protein
VFSYAGIAGSAEYFLHEGALPYLPYEGMFPPASSNNKHLHFILPFSPKPTDED